MDIAYTINIPTIYGNMLVNRFNPTQADVLIKTGAMSDDKQIQIAQQICAIAADNSVMIDIGAGFGAYALSCAAVLKNKQGQVYAFEAQRILSYMLGGSTVLNNLDNLFVHHLYMGNDDKPIDMPKFIPDNNNAQSAIEIPPEKLFYTAEKTHEKVNQIQLDHFQFTNICFMKISTGHNVLATVNGAKQTISNEHPVMQINALKVNEDLLAKTILTFYHGYLIYKLGDNLFCITDEKAKSLGLTLNTPVYQATL